MEKKIISHILYLSILGLFFALPTSAFAATLGFSPSTVSRTVGSTFSIALHVSSADKAMNAASGVVSFPIDKLEVVSISKINSVMNLWVEEPTFSNAKGTVNFEGIALNPGYIGSQGTILSVIFRTKSAGQANIRFTSGSVLANDGVGTNILDGLGTANISIQTIPATQDVKDDGSKPKASDEIEISIPLETPVITYYQEEVESGDLIKIQGIANPGVDVEIRLLRSGESIQKKMARSTASGNFVITIDAPSQPGVYTFAGHAIDQAGNKSEETAPFTVIVTLKWFDQLMESILSYLSLVVLLGLALIGAIVSTIFIWYRSVRVIRRMRRESREAEKMLEKSFNILRKDIASHVARLKSVKRKLTAEEVDFLEQFEKELGEAEEVIAKEIKDISNS